MKLTDDFSKQAIDAAIKIAAIAMLVYWCFAILRPFILLVIWGRSLRLRSIQLLSRFQIRRECRKEKPVHC